MSLGLRSDRTGNQADLERAIENLQEAIAAIPPGSGRAGHLSRLGHARRSRFEQTGDPGDLHQAIELGEQAVSYHPGHPIYASNLGAALCLRFEQTGDPADCARAIDLLEAAAAATADDRPAQAGHLSKLGICLRLRFERAGDLTDLDRAAEAGRQAVTATPAGHPDRPGHLSNFAAILMARFDRTSDLTDLTRAIENLQEAIAATPAGHPYHAAFLCNLGRAMHAWFRQTGDLADLDRAIEAGDKAVSSSPAADPRRAVFLSNLGTSLLDRFERTGDLTSLDRAIEAGQQAVSATPGDHPDRPGHLINLANALSRDFERTGDLTSLDRAIEADQQAVSATPGDHPDRPGYLSNLALALSLRYGRTGQRPDLDRAIEAGEQAIEATPSQHVTRAGSLANFGGCLQDRFSHTGDPADLDKAIDLYRQALNITHPGHSDRPRFLSSLGNAQRVRFVSTGDPADLDQAIDLMQAAADDTVTDHPDRAGLLSNIGIARRIRWTRAGSPLDLNRAIANFREAAGVITSPVDIRAWSAREWGRLAALGEQWAEAVAGFSAAVRLMALLAPRDLDQADQEHRLTKLSGLGPEAAAACAQAGRPDQAVELFEQGRGILFSQELDARSDLTDLANAEPELAAQFSRWRGELDRPGPVATRTSRQEMTPVPARRREAAVAFERVLADIRARPGYEHFLEPRPYQELAAAAVHGPVVIINVAPLRSDAVILTADGVELVPLARVQPDDVVEQVRQFLMALDQIRDPARRPAGEKALSGGLSWLWEYVAEPVLSQLGHHAPPADGQSWPRVWWCPSGLLSLLPLHAAGYHDVSRGGSAAVVDRVISSTIPNVRALLHARRAGTPDAAARTLIVAMPRTPGQADLPGADREARVLESLWPGQVDVLGLPDTEPATHDTVAAALPRHHWAHFACHASNSVVNPSASHFLFSDHRTRPFTVTDLAQAHLDQADLAFLSACTTARTGVALPDEPVHLAAACQLAGYRHVVATLWPVSDNDASYLTQTFYQALRRRLSPTATALHHATRRLRATNRAHPSRWAAYTHTGP